MLFKRKCLPIGVRTADTMYTSLAIFNDLLNQMLTNEN